MERNPEIIMSETNRGKEQIILDKRYKFNFSYRKKDNTKVYRCTEYKTLNKCKSYVILNDNNEILKYENSHNHLEKEFASSISIIKHRIKNEIKKSSTPLNIKPRELFNTASKDIGFKCPEYKTIKSQISRNIIKHRLKKTQKTKSEEKIEKKKS